MLLHHEHHQRHAGLVMNLQLLGLVGLGLAAAMGAGGEAAGRQVGSNEEGLDADYCRRDNEGLHSVPAKAREEQRADEVLGLPGQPASVSGSFCAGKSSSLTSSALAFKQYAGYITVNESAGRALFYWLTESTHNSSSLPLVLWLNGGPGCSSMGYGGMEELGPFKILKNGTGLYSNPHSWNKAANLLFLESPAGVGYSYSNTSSDYNTSGDARTAADSLVFLLRWFERFPQYKNRDFYITGESYAGHYVPQLAHLIYNHNKQSSAPAFSINLKGFMVGNAVTDWRSDNEGIVNYYWSHALISDHTYEGLMKECRWAAPVVSTSHNASTSVRSLMPPACQLMFDNAYSEIGNVDLHTIYTPVCLTPDPYQSQRATSSSPRLLKHWNPLWSGQTGYDPCTPNYADSYFNRPDVQAALHANVSGLIQRPWAICNYDILDNWQDRAVTVLPIYEELIKAGLRIWVYSGDEDAMVPVTGTRFWMRRLKLKTVKRWYPWIFENQVAGWTEVYDGITFSTVRGAGHEVPVLQPKRALTLLMHFLEGKPLPAS